MSIRDNYRIDNHGDRFFVYDFCNRFICSADTRREAEEEIDQLLMSEEESCPKFMLTCLKAKATWTIKKWLSPRSLREFNFKYSKRHRTNIGSMLYFSY